MQQNQANALLSRVLSPCNLVVIGGGAWGQAVIEQARKFGFDGPIWAIHPSKEIVGADQTVPALDDLGFVPDVAYVAVNRHATIDIIRTLSDMGAGGAVCFASGFSEAAAETADGAQLQTDLINAAGSMPILGPNCYGFINGLDRVCVWPDQHGMTPTDRGVAIVTQSSNMMINLTMQRRGLPIAYALTAGNQARVDLVDLAMHALNDPCVSAIGLHIEGVSDTDKLYDLALRAQDLGKGIVAIKVGTSEQAQTATISHTASMAGSAVAGRALFDRLGIGLVADLPCFLEALKILHHYGPLANRRIVSMSCSGGEASLIADLGQAIGIEFPILSDAQRVGLRDALGPKVALANPLDYHTYIWGDTGTMAKCFSAMLSGDDLGLGVIIVDFPLADRCDPASWNCVIDAAAIARENTSTPLALLATLPEGIDEATEQRLQAAGVLCLRGLSDALNAVIAAQRPAPLGPRPWKSQILRDPVTLLETPAKSALAQFGVPVPRSVVCDDFDALNAAFAEMEKPVVLKTSQAAHKTETGGVVVGIDTLDELHAAAHQIGTWPLLVEPMVTGSVAEILVAVQNDQVHGYTLTLGAGGIYTEILRDTVSVTLPVNEQDIRTALAHLKLYPILTGYRGKAGADLGPVVAAIMAVQDYVQANLTQLAEVEINPLIAQAHGAVAVDAVIRKDLE
jgi:acyl-CoA synthetase (NDP forming)